jgi:hypothetical protein
MNKENAHLYLPLVQALADGKTIQLKTGDYWNDSGELVFSLLPDDYRIKPEPRTFVMYINKHTNHICHSNPYDSNWQRITVQEVLE